MKLAAVVTVVMILQAFSSPSPQQPLGSTIEGIVVRGATGEPISGARVQAVPAAPQPPLPAQPPVMPPTITTDAAGRFLVPQLEPGVYHLFVSAETYVSQDCGSGKPVNVAPGQKVTGIRIPLMAAGNVNGHVRDLDGKPLAGVPVQLLKPMYNFRGERTLRSAGAASTNDRGEYRVFWVTPGRYYVIAGSAYSIRRPPLAGVAGPNEIPGQSVLPTYYPNAAELSGATPVDVQSGADLTGFDFAVQRQPARRIRGRVIDAVTGRWPPSA